VARRLLGVQSPGPSGGGDVDVQDISRMTGRCASRDEKTAEIAAYMKQNPSLRLEDGDTDTEATGTMRT
jgi:hypothetical protein